MQRDAQSKSRSSCLVPHIHTQPNQHDVTISAYVLLQLDGEWKCLVHLHRKMGKLMQVGGHIELDETPWQAVAHELAEETGYTTDEVEVLQPFSETPLEGANIAHPVPFSTNTHNVGDDHYHSDSCYGFIATAPPKQQTAVGESKDLRWLSIDELDELAKTGEALEDVTYIYRYLIEHVDKFVRVRATTFSVEKPGKVSVTYQTGKPSELRDE